MGNLGLHDREQPAFNFGMTLLTNIMQNVRLYAGFKSTSPHSVAIQRRSLCGSPFHDESLAWMLTISASIAVGGLARVRSLPPSKWSPMAVITKASSGEPS